MNNKSKIECHIQSLIGGRSENQDSAGVMETDIGTVVVVCDGMGALNGGSTASKIAVTTVINDIAAAQPDESVAEVLKAAIIHANNAIIDAAENDDELAGMGTTLTAIIINDECATLSYLGDSRIYQLRGRNKVFRTFDHSLVFQSVRVGLITEEQARLSSQSNIITKALGVTKEIDVEIHEQPYLAGDRFVLCTDGFWGAMPEKELLPKIAKGNVSITLEKTAIQIDLLGIRNGRHHDNLTAAMFDVTKDSKRKVKMSKKAKLILALLILALVASLALNVYQCVKYGQNCSVENNATTSVPDDAVHPEEAAQTDQKDAGQSGVVDEEADIVVNNEAVAPADSTASSSIE